MEENVRNIPLEDHPLLNGFEGQAGRLRQSIFYRLGLLLVAMATVLLPIIYIALIGAVTSLVAWHFIHNFDPIMNGRLIPRIRLFAYLAPGAIGVVAVLFMIKPLFARYRQEDRPYQVSRQAEPLLFEFVDRLCAVIGAPVPSRIDVSCQVNASAHFRRGWLSFLGNDLVLTIGLPLAAGMTVNEFASVLAHEFGHFSQGAAMRLTYIIRSINGWFARVVYERDNWDIQLEEFARSSSGFLSFTGALARGLVWLNRRILWCLMMTGHLISSYMLRQMEYDADQYAAELCGSKAYERTLKKLPLLAVSSHRALAQSQESWKDQRLCDNLMALTLSQLRLLPPPLVKAITEEQQTAKTGLLDSHPCDPDRIRRVEYLDLPGLYHLKEPATKLFRNFKKLSREVTRDFYQEVIGLKVTHANLVAAEEYCQEQDASCKDMQSFHRYYQDLLGLANPVVITGAINPPRQLDAVADTMKKYRQKLLGQLESTRQARARIIETKQSITRCSLAITLIEACLQIDPKAFGLPSADRVVAVEALQQLRQQAALQAKPLQEIATLFAARLAAGLSVLCHAEAAQQLPLEENWKQQTAALLKMLPPLITVFPRLDNLLLLRNHAVQVYRNLEHYHQAAKLIEVLQAMAKEAGIEINLILDDLKKAPYPFDHAGGKVSIADYATPELVKQDHFMAVFRRLEEVVDKLVTLYYRALGRLAALAEMAEQHLGLEPLPKPQEQNQDEPEEQNE